MNQEAGVAREGGRVAADVDDAPRRGPAWRKAGVLVQVGQGLGQSECPLAWRVDQPLVRLAVASQLLRRDLEEVARHERGPVGDAVVHRVFARPGDQRLAALDAQHLSGLCGQGQGEVAQPTEPVDHPLRGLDRQQAQGTPHEHLVDGVVDLGEIGRSEGHVNAELGQVVAEGGQRLVERVNRVRPLGLQPP